MYVCRPINSFLSACTRISGVTKSSVVLQRGALLETFNDVSQRRTLFSSEFLGLEGFQRQKAQLVDRLGDTREGFISRMREYVEGPQNNTIFTDDLKTMVYISESDEEINITVNMINRFNAQNNDLRFSNFAFGPLVMRLLYERKKVDLAVSLYKDETLREFFSNTSTCMVLLDLLYEEKRYTDVLDIMDSVVSRVGREGLGFNNVTIYLAAAYKLNNVESLERVVAQLKQVKGLNEMVTVRGAAYTCMLALNQNKPEIAAELLSLPQFSKPSNTSQHIYINIKALVYLRLGRVTEAVQLLKSLLEAADEPDTPSMYRRQVLQDVVSEIEEAVLKSGDKDDERQMKVVLRSLRQGDQVSNLTLAQHLDRPILRKRRLQDGYKQRLRSDPSSHRLMGGAKQGIMGGAKQVKGRPGLLD